MARAASSRGVAPRLAGGRAPSIKLVVFGAVALALGAVLAVAALQESRRDVPGAARSGPAPTARPALTRAEEAFAQALWPIHNEVKSATLKLVSGSIQVKLKGLDLAQLRPRVDSAAGVYEQAESALAALQPPESLGDAHAQYQRAVRLYRQALTELALAYADGDEAHLDAAAPPREEASQILRQVGLRLWPNEYVPN